MATLVAFRDVSYEVGGRRILDGIQLEIDEGETLVLLGRSGSGKTTLLKTVNRIIEPTSGQVFFQQKPNTEIDAIELRRKIGYVIQDAGLFPHRTVEQNVGLIPRLQKWPQDQISKRTAELLQMVGLPIEVYGQRFPARLSGGEKQRVGIARALAAKPSLLLLDEPFGALDPVTRFEMQRQFKQLQGSLNQTAIFVTHDIREALMLASRIALLKDGKLEIVAKPEEFRSAKSAEARAFLTTLEDAGNPSRQQAYADN